MISHKWLGHTYTDDKGVKWLFVRSALYQGYPAFLYRQVPADFELPDKDAVYVPVGQKKSAAAEADETGYTAPITPATATATATPITTQPVVTIPTSDTPTISDTPPFPVETVIDTITNKDKVLGLAVMAGIGLTFAYWLKHH